MPKLTNDERDAFLSELRYGILTMQREDGSPIGVPVWYDWDGEAVRLFAASNSPKIARLTANPQASLLVVNNLDETEMWVAFDGEVSISSEGGMALAEQLAARYWSMTEPRHVELLAAWREVADQIWLLTLKPSRIRSYRD